MHTFQAWEPLTQRLTYALLHFVWQGPVIALTLALIVQLCRVRRAEWRYCFSLAALFAMLTAPIMTLLLIDVPSRNFPVAADARATAIATVPSQAIDRHTPEEMEQPSFEPADRSTSLAATATDSTPVSVEPAQLPQSNAAYSTLWQQIQPWIIAFWTVGVALLSTRLLIGWIGLWRLRRRGIAAPDWLAEQLQTLAIDLRMAAPELRLSHQVSEAIALGFLRPLVLIPAAWVTQMPPDMLEAVLAHELAHIRRHDLWVNLFQRLVETLLFYHPAVWWLSRRIRTERELCCDELVVQMTQDPLRYAETLEHIGRLSLQATPLHLTVSILGSRSILSDRIRNILRLRPQEQSSWAWLAGVLPLMLAGVVYWSVASVNDRPVHAEDEKPAASLTVDGPIGDERIFEVRITGNVTISEEEIRKHIKFRPGHEVMPSRIKHDVDALIRTRWFSHVEPVITRTDEGNVLTFKLVERPLVRKVEYKGTQKIKTAVFNKITQLRPGQPYDVSVNRECVRRIQDHYREKGFPFATVELERGDVQSDTDREVVFLIEEGPKVKVTKVDFEGNKTFYDPVLQTKTRTKTQILWLLGGKYDPSTINDDIKEILNYYHSLGYFDVQITPEQTFSDDKSQVQLHYKIDEGLRYRINEISFMGNEVLSEADIRALTKVKSGDEYNERHINKDVEAILAKYGSQGRLFAQVVPVRKWSEEPGVLNLVYRIDEDKVYLVRAHQDSDQEPKFRASLSEDKKADETRRLTFAASDPKSRITARTLDSHSDYRHRGEYVGGVSVLLEDPAQKWKMIADRVLVEMDADRLNSTATPRQTILELESDTQVLSTKPPLKITLKGNVSVSYSKVRGATSAELKAEQVVLDFQRQQLQAERVQLRSGGNLFEGDRLVMTFAALALPIGTPELRQPPVDNSPMNEPPASPAKLKLEELPRLREQRQQNNDREFSKSLVGEWVLDLPAGASFPVTITQREDGCLALGNGRNLGGTFAYRDKRLKLFEQSQSGIEDFIWEQQPEGWFKLIHEQHSVGASYVGATLSKGGIVPCGRIERQLLKTFPQSSLELRSSPQKVVVRGLAQNHDERSRIMAAVVSRMNELQQARKGQGVEVIDEMHFPEDKR